MLRTTRTIFSRDGIAVAFAAVSVVSPIATISHASVASYHADLRAVAVDTLDRLAAMRDGVDTIVGSVVSPRTIAIDWNGYVASQADAYCDDAPITLRASACVGTVSK